MSRFVFLLIGLMSTFVNADSSVWNAKITHIMQDAGYPEFMFIDIDKEPSNRPDCHTHPRYEYVVDLTTDFGKRVQSLVLSAYMASQNVHILGAGDDDCNVNNIEILRRLEIDK
jgi:hypothetical protein